jgi:hypothetical protein
MQNQIFYSMLSKFRVVTIITPPYPLTPYIAAAEPLSTVIDFTHVGGKFEREPLATPSITTVAGTAHATYILLNISISKCYKAYFEGSLLCFYLIVPQVISNRVVFSLSIMTTAFTIGLLSASVRVPVIVIL